MCTERQRHLPAHLQDVGFRVWDSGSRVQGSGFRVQISGFRVRGSGFGVQGSGFRVQGLPLLDPAVRIPPESTRGTPPACPRCNDALGA